VSNCYKTEIICLFKMFKYLTKIIEYCFIIILYLYSNFNADTENMNNGLGNSVGRGNSRPRGTSGRGRGSRHDFYANSMYFVNLFICRLKKIQFLFINTNFF